MDIVVPGSEEAVVDVDDGIAGIVARGALNVFDGAGVS